MRFFIPLLLSTTIFSAPLPRPRASKFWVVCVCRVNDGTGDPNRDLFQPEAVVKIGPDKFLQRPEKEPNQFVAPWQVAASDHTTRDEAERAAARINEAGPKLGTKPTECKGSELEWSLGQV